MRVNQLFDRDSTPTDGHRYITLTVYPRELSGYSRSGRGVFGRPWQTELDPPVALTAMGKPLFKASDGGYYEVVRVTEDSTRVDSGKSLIPPCFLEKKFAPKPFRVACSCPYWRKIMQYPG